MARKRDKPSRAIYLFCYGSLNAKMIEYLTGSKLTAPPRPAVLPNHIRVFAGESGYWSGAVASVYPRKGSKVYGAVVTLTNEQFKSVDEYEGGYTRKVRQVHIIDPATGALKPVYANIYVRDEYNYVVPPSRRYIASIATTLREVGLEKHDPIPVHGVFQVQDEEGHKRPVLAEVEDKAARERTHGHHTPAQRFSPKPVAKARVAAEHLRIQENRHEHKKKNTHTSKTRTPSPPQSKSTKSSIFGIKWPL